jgi:RNA polymerase sigma-70 factor (ECF subfamily)
VGNQIRLPTNYLLVTQTQVIAVYQPTLQAIAVRMLGSMTDAEDAVHDTFLKWLTIDTTKIENIKAYLVRMVTNACLNIINARNRRKSTPLEEFEEVLEDKNVENTLTLFDVENQLNEAWAFMHRKLEPVERGIFVLRELFNVDYEDLQVIFDRKADNCRKIVSRAKEKLKTPELPKLPISLPSLPLLESFRNACHKGHLAPLISDLYADLFYEK